MDGVSHRTNDDNVLWEQPRHDTCGLYVLDILSILFYIPRIVDSCPLMPLHTRRRSRAVLQPIFHTGRLRKANNHSRKVPTAFKTKLIKTLLSIRDATHQHLHRPTPQRQAVALNRCDTRVPILPSKPVAKWAYKPHTVGFPTRSPFNATTTLHSEKY